MVAKPPCPFGQYWLVELLSEGGTGAAYLAIEVESRRAVVIKRLRDELAGDPVLSMRLKHEAAIAVSVDSPHVVEVYDVGAVGGEPYVAMAYLPGWTIARLLSSLAERHALLPLRDVVALFADGLRGLAALHAAMHPTTAVPLGVVHRDIAPRNLILGQDHRLKIIDLGIGRSNIQEWATRTGTLLGTPGYMAPEQVLGRRVDHRTDLYALFVVAFELATGVHYLARGDRQAMFAQCVDGAYRKPSLLRPEISGELDRLFERGLQVQPDDRFASAEEALAALEAAYGATPSLDPASLPNEFAAEVQLQVERVAAFAREAAEQEEDRATTVVYARRSPKRRRTREAAAIALAFAAVAGIFIGLELARPSDPDPAPPPEVAPIAAEPRVEVSPRAIEEAPPPEVAPKKARASKLRPPSPPIAPPPIAPPKSEVESFDAIIRGAGELRARHPERQADLDELIADALLWRRAEDSDQRRAALAELRARLDRAK